MFFFSHTLSPRPCNGNVLAIANYFLMYVCIWYTLVLFWVTNFYKGVAGLLKELLWFRVNVGKATHRLMNQTSRVGNPLLEYLCLSLLTTHSSAVATTSWWFFSNIILHLCWTFCTLWYLKWMVPRLWLTIAALCWLAMLLHLQICNFFVCSNKGLSEVFHQPVCCMVWNLSASSFIILLLFNLV